MDVQRIITELDAEIEHLQNIRASLSGLPTRTGAVASAPVKGRRGRPKGSKNTPKGGAAEAAPAKTAAKKQSKRKLSPEGRKAIAEAMKRRWAERRKETGK